MKEKLLFNLISPIYGQFYNLQRKWFKEAIENAKNTIDIEKYSTALDVGCGTGSLCSVLAESGLAVTGVDAASSMISIAKKKDVSDKIEFQVVNPDLPLPFPDDSFELVFSSYVLHGMKSNARERLYLEMKRVAKDAVIIHDYNSERSIMTNIIEFLEGGDYFNFIKVAEKEMRGIFKEVSIAQVGVRTSWYICKLKF